LMNRKRYSKAGIQRNNSNSEKPRIADKPQKNCKNKFSHCGFKEIIFDHIHFGKFYC
jgi:hypothetical protein